MLTGTSAQPLERTPHFEVWEDAALELLVIVRTPLAVLTPADVPVVLAMLKSCLTPRRANYGLIIDMRAVVGRSDDPFVELMRPLRAFIAERYPAHVLLVRSAVGKLQAQRISRADSRGGIVVMDEEEAVQVALGQRGSKGPAAI